MVLASTFKPFIEYAQQPTQVGVSAPLDPNAGSMTQLGGIKAEQAATYQPLSAELANNFRATLGAAPTVGYSAIAPQIAQMTPNTIQGLPDQYFDSQKSLLKEQLRDEFFGRNGQWDTGVSNESAAGRLGSGVGRQMLQKTVTEPFVKASTQIDSTIMQALMQERARVEGFNADQFNKYNALVSNALSVDSSNKLQADTASANLQAEYVKLSSTLADAEAGRLSQEGIAQLETNLRLFQSVLEDRRKADALAIEQEKNYMEDFRKEQANQIDYLRTPIKASSISQEQQSTASQLSQGFGNTAYSTTGSSTTQPASSAPTYTTTNAPNEFPRSGLVNGQTFKAPNGVTYMAVVTGTGYNASGNWIPIG